MKKNLGSQLIACQLVSATDGSNVTTGTTTVAIEIDGTPGTGGTATHIANGKWEFAPIQADTNGDHLTFQFTNAAAVSAMLNVYTGFPQTVDNNVLAAGVTGFGAINTDVELILADTGTDGVVIAAAQTVATVTNLSNLPTIPANWLTAAGTHTDFTTEIQTGLATAASITALNDIAATDIVSAGAITTLTGAVVNVTNVTANCADVTNLSNLPTIPTNWITADGLATDAVTEIRDSILPVSGAALNNLEFLFVAASDHVTPVTGAGTITVTVSKDGGAFGAGGGSTPTQVGNGIYQYDATGADMTGGIITFRFAATTGTPGAPDDTFLTIITGAGV